MTHKDIEARLRLAERVAREAGVLALAFWRDRAALDVHAKGSPQDLVSEADRAVERSICESIAAAFPDDGFLGEEYGLSAGASGLTWIIDPIDGTAPFLHGMPNWCVALALVRGPETLGGVIDVPTHGEQFAAHAGGGATLNGVRLAIPPELGLRTGSVGLGASHRTDPQAAAAAVAALLDAGGMFFRNGSGALMLAYVAAGRLAGYFETVMYPWDCRAALLMIREAGGRTAPFGDPDDLVHDGPVLAAAPGAWDDLDRLFGAEVRRLSPVSPAAAGAGAA